MKEFAYTLVTDGSSDRVLMPIINWVLDQIGDLRYVPQFAEFVPKASVGISQRVRSAMSIYECDLLIIHRDAENVSLQERTEEIRLALADLDKSFVPIVPVRMSEAWLLLDERAIRTAASNPNGRTHLNLPRIETLETQINPKLVLFEALRAASELPQRRLQKFRPESCRHRIAEISEDFQNLRRLSAFRQFESDLITAVARL